MFFFNIFQCNLLPAGSTSLCLFSVCPNRDEEIRQKAAALTISPISLPLQIIPLSAVPEIFSDICSPFQFDFIGDTLTDDEINIGKSSAICRHVTLKAGLKKQPPWWI